MILITIFIVIFIPHQVFATEPDLKNPGVIMKICADDPAFISNLEEHMYDTDLDSLLSWCPEEYTQYSQQLDFLF